MKKEDMAVLNQMIISLDESVSQMEKFYIAKDYDSFNQSKKIILELNKKIAEILR